MMRTLRIYSQQLACITYSSVHYIYRIVHYIPSTYLQLEVCTFWLLSSNSPSPYPIPTSGNHKSGLFFYEFACLFVFEVLLTYYTMLVPIHNIVIWCFYTFQNDPQDKSNLDLSPYKEIT